MEKIRMKFGVDREQSKEFKALSRAEEEIKRDQSSDGGCELM
uniref:Uncharacterized protein n=1 Tax=Anguilla anguilla TaxID=7936 RepID=A0A0E9USP9_ANGAN